MIVTSDASAGKTRYTMNRAKFLEICASHPWPEVRTALENGADPNTVNDDGVSALMLAAKGNTADTVNALLEHGAYINAKDNGGRTALMYAGYNPDFKVLNALIAGGANANAKDRNGRTPLMYAAEHNTNPLVIRDLLKARAFVNARDTDGKTPLAFAVMRRSPNPDQYIVRELLHFGANPDIHIDGRRLECFAKDSPSLRRTRALRALRAAS